MSRRRRKEQKRKEKRLERLPEKLQRKRDRQERYKARRMPGWIRTGLVVALFAVIIVGAIIIWPKPSPVIPELIPGDVDILQQDMFYIFINETGAVQIDYMHGRFGAGTFEGNQPLNVSIIRIFEESSINFTFPDTNVFYDYFGNAYNIIPIVDSDSLEYTINAIYPNFVTGDSLRHLEGGSQMVGWYSLFWDYYLNSSDNAFLATEILENMFTFTFTIQPENNTLPYNTPTIVHCNITYNTLRLDGNTLNYGESMIIFPKQVYNDTTLLANITVHDVIRIGSNINPNQNPTINNETHIGFRALPITVSMSQNQSWGYTFDLNVTRFTNTSFCLFDFTTPENKFFMQSGNTPTVEEQPMHFPKSEMTIDTPWSDRFKRNVTNFYFRFPKVIVNNSAISYQVELHQPRAQLRPSNLFKSEINTPKPRNPMGSFPTEVNEWKTLITIPTLSNLRRLPIIK